MSVARLIDATAETIRATDPDDLPVLGKLWTLRIEDDEIVLRIKAAKKRINDTPQPRLPPPQPKPQPGPAVPKPKPPKKGDK